MYPAPPSGARTVSARPLDSRVIPIGETEFDVEYWPEDNLRAAVAGPARGDRAGSTGIFTLKGFYELKVAHRIVSGFCLSGGDYWRGLRATAGAETFGDRLAGLFHALCQDVFDDAAKLFDVADYPSAILSAQNALRAAAGAALARRGRPVFKEKWLYHALLQVYGDGHEIPRRYWELLTQVDQRDLGRHAAAMLDFTNLLVNEGADVSPKFASLPACSACERADHARG